MLRIYQIPHSPYCLSIIQAARAGGAALELVTVANGDRSEILRLTKGESWNVPLLEHAGRLIWEENHQTQVIARYLDARFGVGRLFPASLDGLRGILVPHIENEIEDFAFRLQDIHVIPAIADPIERGLVRRHKERKFGVGCLAEWTRGAQHLREELERHLHAFEQMLEGGRAGSFLLAPAPVFTDFALWGVISNYVFAGRNTLPERFPRLRDWHQRLAAFRYR